MTQLNIFAPLLLWSPATKAVLCDSFSLSPVNFQESSLMGVHSLAYTSGEHLDKCLKGRLSYPLRDLREVSQHHVHSRSLSYESSDGCWRLICGRIFSHIRYIHRAFLLNVFYSVQSDTTSERKLFHTHYIQKVSLLNESDDEWWDTTSGRRISHIRNIHRLSLPCVFSDADWELNSGRTFFHIHYIHRASLLNESCDV